jgi:hypothetical protein
MFEAEIKMLEEVKRGVFAAFQGPDAEAMPPAIAGAVRNFDTFVDTTYLWVLQIREFVSHLNAAKETAAAAAERGEVPVVNLQGGELPDAG